MRLWIAVTLGALLLLGLAAYLFLRPSPPSSSLKCFASLPPDFLAAWQVDMAALRGFVPARPFLSKLDASADRACGVLTPESKVAVEGRSPALALSAENKLSTWEERKRIPTGGQGWLLAKRLSDLPSLRAITLSSGTTVELPAEVMTARWAVVSVKAGTLSLALTAEAEYQDEAEAQRAASALRGFLSLVKNIHRTRIADQALQSFLNSTIVETEGNRVFLKAVTP